MSIATADTVGRLIADSERERKLESSSHEQELLDLKYLGVCVQMHSVKLAYLRLADDTSV